MLVQHKQLRIKRSVAIDSLKSFAADPSSNYIIVTDFGLAYLCRIVNNEMVMDWPWIANILL